MGLSILPPEETTACRRCFSETLEWNEKKTEKICPECGCRHGMSENENPFIEFLVDPKRHDVNKENVIAGW